MMVLSWHELEQRVSAELTDQAAAWALADEGIGMKVGTLPEAKPKPEPMKPWKLTREQAEAAATLAAEIGMRPTAERLQVNRETLRNAWRWYGIPTPTLPRQRRSTGKASLPVGPIGGE